MCLLQTPLKSSTQIRRGKRTKKSEELSFYLPKTDVQKSYPNLAPDELVVTLMRPTSQKNDLLLKC